jgi:uncharacterized caspase-like protein
VLYVAAALITASLFAGGMSAAHAVVNDDAVAVVIGNSNYSGDRIPNVDYAHRDAAAFRRYLIDVQGYREGNIIDLRDATQAQMEAALGNDRTHEGTLWQYVRTEGSDVTVYYSGHGVPGLKSKRGYLLPVDADPNKPEINGYPVDTLYANLAKLSARSVTVYLDACFSGDSPRGMLINATSGITVVPRLPKKNNKLTILTAASGDQVASWDTENRHGLFTEHLLAALYGAADAQRYGVADGKVTLGEVKKYLARNMSYAAKRTYGRIQHATINGDAGVVLAALGKSRPRRPLIQNLGQFDAKSNPAIRLEPIEGTYVALRNANVRAAPDVNASKITTLPKGSKVDVAGKVASKDWLAVDQDGKRLGYVYSKLLRDAETRVAAVIPPKVTVPKATKDAVGVFMSPGLAFRDCADCPEMVVIPPGRFRMGDLNGNGDSDEKPMHDVRIKYSFAVGKFEVTQSQWQSVMGGNPSRFKGANRPVERVRPPGRAG